MRVSAVKLEKYTEYHAFLSPAQPHSEIPYDFQKVTRDRALWQNNIDFVFLKEIVGNSAPKHHIN